MILLHIVLWLILLLWAISVDGPAKQDGELK